MQLASTRLPSGDEWKAKYIQHTVNLAYLMTECLVTQMSTNQTSNLDFSLMSNQNFIILVDSISLSIHAVNFQATASLQCAGRRPETMYQRCICTALGNILLDIFSLGQSNVLEFNGGDESSSTPAAKRQARELSRTRTDPISSAAERLLLSLDTPLSICRLICDLLDSISVPPNTAITSLDDALDELNQIRFNPEKYLVDCACPTKALEETRLFSAGNAEVELFGRERELDVLMNAKQNISTHALGLGNASSRNNGGFMSEALFLSGNSGSGKSSLLHRLVNQCTQEKWYVETSIVLTLHLNLHVTHISYLFPSSFAYYLLVKCPGLSFPASLTNRWHHTRYSLKLSTIFSESGESQHA